MAAAPRRRVGRPSSLAPAVVERLLDALRAGVPIAHAVTHAGISRPTYYRWMTRAAEERDWIAAGRPPHPGDAAYVQFADLVDQAHAEAVVRAVDVINHAATGQRILAQTTRQLVDEHGQHVIETTTRYAPPEWRAAAWILTRLHPDEFGTHRPARSSPASTAPVSTAHIATLADRIAATSAQHSA